MASAHLASRPAGILWCLLPAIGRGRRRGGRRTHHAHL